MPAYDQNYWVAAWLCHHLGQLPDCLLLLASVLFFRKHCYQYFNSNSVIAAIALNSFAQLLYLPTPLYLAEVWFPLEKRSFVIGIAFYSNLLGFGLGGTLSSLLYEYPIITPDNIILFISGIATLAFVVVVLIVKNRPKVRIEAKKRV